MIFIFAGWVTSWPYTECTLLFGIQIFWMILLILSKSFACNQSGTTSLWKNWI